MEAKLNSAQMGIYADCLSNPENMIYNLGFFQRLRDDIDIDRLEAAIEKAIAAHPTLKCVIGVDDSGAPVLRTVEREAFVQIIEIGEEEEKRLPDGQCH